MTRERLASLAWRNIWRNRRRTLITLFGISFGVLLAVLFTGIGDYTYGQMIDHAAKLGGGHVVVQDAGYQELPTLEKTVVGTAEVERRALEEPRVAEAVSRISGAAMIASASGSQGTFFMAVDPARETAGTLAILDAIVEGEMLAPGDDQGIVLGSGLAETLDVSMGKKVVYTLTDRHGEIVSGLARVRGIVRSGAPSLDGGLCLLPIGPVRELLGYRPDEATQVAVFVRDHRDAASVADALRDALPEGSVALGWDEAQPELAGFIAMKESSTVILEGVIMALLAAGIFNTLFVSVMERLREFGIMTAIGFSARSLFVLVMWESLWVALVGLGAAALLTALPYWHLHTAGLDYAAMVGEGAEVAGIALEPILRVSIYPVHALSIALAVIVATMASGLYPAWRAGRTNPADVIRLQ